jgi:hypothetical protein
MKISSIIISLQQPINTDIRVSDVYVLKQHIRGLLYRATLGVQKFNSALPTTRWQLMHFVRSYCPGGIVVAVCPPAGVERAVASSGRAFFCSSIFWSPEQHQRLKGLARARVRGDRHVRGRRHRPEAPESGGRPYHHHILNPVLIRPCKENHGFRAIATSTYLRGLCRPPRGMAAALRTPELSSCSSRRLGRRLRWGLQGGRS